MKFRICTSAEKIPDGGSWLIMRFTKFDASHVFVVCGDEVFEADSDGVKRAPLAPLLSTHYMPNDIEIEVPCTKEQFEDWFRAVEHTPYSLRQWFGFIMPKWTHFLFKNGRKGAICSEFVCWFLNDLAGWEMPEDEFKTPQQVIEFVKSKVG